MLSGLLCAEAALEMFRLHFGLLMGEISWHFTPKHEFSQEAERRVSHVPTANDKLLPPTRSTATFRIFRPGPAWQVPPRLYKLAVSSILLYIYKQQATGERKGLLFSSRTVDIEAFLLE